MLVMVIGLPGSGKSTYCRNCLVPHGFRHYEADMYFMRDGEYKFNRDELHLAHSWCRERVYKDVSKGFDVCVSNTSLKKWERAVYISIAAEFDVPILVVTLDCKYKSIHNIPEDVFARMKSSYEPFSTKELL